MQVTSPKTIQTAEITAIICDCCGKRIEIINSQPAEDILFINKSWSDGELKDTNHQFELCQKCYLAMVDKTEVNIRVGKVRTVVIS